MNLNSFITTNSFNGNNYVAIARFSGDMYPQSIRNAIRDGRIAEIAKAEDSKGLLQRYFSAKYRKTPEGYYVNPWISDDDKAFWFAQKNNIIRYFGELIPETNLYWLCQDLKVLPEAEAEIVWDIITRNNSKDDINLVLCFTVPGYSAIIKLYGDGTTDEDGDYVVTKANAWDNDQTKYGFGDKIAKIMKGWKLPSKLDNPNLGDWYVPEIKTDEQYIYEHLHGLDLEKEPEFDMEREFARASKDAAQYTWANLGWALARSANSHRCGGPEAEEGFSRAFFEMLDDAPDNAKDFFHWLNIKWGNNYLHISPDQQALWNVLRDFDNYASQKEKDFQFNTFVNWILNWERAIPHIVEVNGKEEKRGIWSYKAYPMYGPKAYSYRDGKVIGDAVLVSYEALIEREWNEDDEPQDSQESDQEALIEEWLASEGLEDLDF